MNHNFVSWEITQMLPKIDKHKWTITTCFWYKRYSLKGIGEKEMNELVILPFKPDSNSIVRTSVSGELLSISELQDCVYYKQRYTGIVAWTFEDVRLYLKEKGYILTQTIDTNDINYHCVDVFLFEDGYEGHLELSFRDSTFEKARETAIIHCLNLINNGNNNNT